MTAPQNFTAAALPKPAAQAVAILAACTFRAFNKYDWHAFSDCESADPMICERDDGLTVILDGATCNFLVFLDDGGVADAVLSLG